MPKKSSDALREVWNGRDLSAATVESPLPPWFSSPSCLANLEASDDRPLLMSARDGACFFDQLKVPEGLQPYLGKPYVTFEELCRSGSHGDSSVDFAPLLQQSLREFLLVQTLPRSKDLLECIQSQLAGRWATVGRQPFRNM